MPGGDYATAGADSTASDPRGMWGSPKRGNQNATLTSEQQEAIRRLTALGYVGGSTTPVTDATMTVLDETKAYQAASLYTSGHGPEASLIDMEGNELHSWRFSYRDGWPDPAQPPEQEHFRRVHLYENGDLLLIYSFGIKGVLKLDKDSNLLWVKPDVVPHHDLDVASDGDIYVLTREAHIVPRVHESAPILEDFITILDGDGREKRRVSMLRSFENSAFHDLWLERKTSCAGRFETEGGCQDLFHTNSVWVLDGRLADVIPAFKKGNILTSFRHLDMIAVVDPVEERVVWVHRGSFKAQHDPKVLANGNLLLFDNRGRRRRSSVTEVDPLTGEIVWEFWEQTRRPFFSGTMGAAHRMPNGNTLIIESVNGRVFEVTPEHETVWEFHNPHRTGERNELIAVVFDMVRLPPSFPLNWVRNSSDAP